MDLVHVINVQRREIFKFEGKHKQLLTIIFELDANKTHQMPEPFIFGHLMAILFTGITTIL